jgi:hypothetical protein
MSLARLDYVYRRQRLAQLPRRLRLAAVATGLSIAIATVVASAFAPVFGFLQFAWVTAVFFHTQDAFWLAAIALLLGLLAVTPLPIMTSRAVSAISRRPHAIPICLAVLVVVVGVVGAHIVFHGYPLSRDEFLAGFDAAIFRSGRLIAPIAPDWRPLAEALAPRFMLPIADGTGFASAYLPVNAGLRAMVGLMADPDWTNPLLAACAVIATFGVGRRLWPARPDAAFLAALLVASSPQVLVTAMTSYAMSAHLALNMIWLWFFLRDDRIGHGGAIATGFLATGLHQLIFHPLFAAPFVVRLWISGRRPLALVYIVSYSTICLFWASYWKIALSGQGISPQVSDSVGVFYFLYRVIYILKDFEWAGASVMLKNLLRFVDWQNPALLPLSVLAYLAVRRGSGTARELIAGVLLTLVAMFVIIPYQGYGWGYRYLHGFIGSLALLAGYGWVMLTERATEHEIGVSRTMLTVCTAFAWLVLLPAHAEQAHDFAAPYARASRAIEQASSDLVIVDISGLAFAEDLVRNDPFLRNRPKVLDLTDLTEAEIGRLCARFAVSVFDYGQALALGIPANDRATERGDAARAALRANMAQRGCGAEPVVRTMPPAR